MEIYPGEILVFIVIFLFLFVGIFLLFLRQGRRLGNRLLGAFFLAHGLTILDGYFFVRGVYDFYPQFAFWLNPLALVYGPFLYGYTLSIIYSDFRLQRRHWMHFIPFLLLSGVFLVTYHLQPSEAKRVFMEHAKSDNSWYVKLATLILYGQIIAYIVASFRAIRRYRRNLESRYSNPELANVSWLEFTIIAFALLIFINLGLNLLRMAALDITPVGLLVLTFFIFLFIISVIIKALRHSRIFAGIPQMEAEAPRYIYSPLDEAERQALGQRLRELMETERAYLNPDLGLEDLAARLEVSPKLLSQVINGDLGQNFFDLVNRYRIEEARQLLLENKKRTILEIMYDVGFNSKSSFNTAFKKYTDMTPTAYRKGGNHTRINRI